MTDTVFEILRAAVRTVRDQQVQRLVTLKAMLLEQFPGQNEDIATALRFWANQLSHNHTD